MDAINKIKKIQRNLKKLQHTVFKETGLHCDSKPTKNLVIANSGLVNGLSEEIIFEHFSNYGSLENILLLPGKSCSFVSYQNINSACRAFENCNGKLNIAQDDKPVYLLYTGILPKVKSNITWDKLPPGLIILQNFISVDEEVELLKLCNFEENLSLMKNRQVKHYGYEFRYDINNIDKDKPLKESIPNQCKFLWDRLQETYNLNFRPDQLTINQYSSGQGIPHHIDTHSAFEDPIISLSLQSSVVMEFKNDEEHICVLLPHRSLTIISGESRYNWTHGIIPRKFDIIHSNNSFTSLARGLRTSFTFRKILQGECNCSYKSKCDSYKKHAAESAIENINASQLEKLHVHEIYENIAAHFSDTRHKPWPNVLEFVQSFETGSILIDVGCGNGKYLGQIKNSFGVGCDQSSGLINICKDRGFEVFVSNCLNIPLRDNIADGILSIAVIHHLSNEDRRLQAIREITRVLTIGGRALIYVWAKDQCKDKEKSSYIKQDRKNRRSEPIITNIETNQEVTVLNGISLPVHTNRTQFKHSDLLVPWKLKNQYHSDDTFLRYYHVFEEKELDDLCKKVNNLEILKNYYDQGNWCAIIRKI
ncbi:alkylated DNA repair protein alkB homolog 8 [Anoplophora glabripennis]|uniref:alkylated DNA repair protein alkB homolog 8 n=1 Tax=Anoplophora glabripennis TaxID=217634 RepID=UPI0008755062|nr:alkylated DNA repair protein alkB homolog 8 [Anoplophora glabripennis]